MAQFQGQTLSPTAVASPGLELSESVVCTVQDSPCNGKALRDCEACQSLDQANRAAWRERHDADIPAIEGMVAIKWISQGVCSHVVEFRVHASGQQVAAKFLRVEEQEGLPCEVLRELQVLVRATRNRCPYIVPMFGYWCSPQLSLVLMPRYAHDLRHYMQTRRRLAEPEIRHIVRCVTQGLEHLHARHILHRDIKPDNILLDATGREVRLGDFTLARVAPAGRETRQGGLTQEVQTLWYRAPEIMLSQGTYGAPADIWALGAVALECVLGAPVFDRELPKKAKKGAADDEEVQTLQKITTLLGTVDERSWPGVETLGRADRLRRLVPSPGCWPHILEQRGRTVSPAGQQWIENCLLWCPARRPTVWALLLRYDWLRTS